MKTVKNLHISNIILYFSTWFNEAVDLIYGKTSGSL